MKKNEDKLFLISIHPEEEDGDHNPILDLIGLIVAIVLSTLMLFALSPK